MNFIDFHCDTLMRLYLLEHKKKAPESLWENTGHLDFKRMISSGYTAQFFAAFLDLPGQTYAGGLMEDALAMAEILKKEISSHQDKVAQAFNYSDYQKNKNENKLSAFLAVEEGGIIGDDLANLDRLHTAGFRAITLTWNHENTIGFPNKDYTYQNNGLKPFGIETVERMDELGMIVDCSHLSDAGFYDVVKYGKRPFLATHSNAREVCAHTRNLTDDMIKKLAERGGMSGINFCRQFVSSDNKSLIEYMINHIRRFINVGGLESIGLGSDFDGIYGVDDLTGAQDMQKLPEALSRAGFKDFEIEAVCYKNAEEFLKRYFS